MPYTLNPMLPKVEDFYDQWSKQIFTNTNKSLDDLHTALPGQISEDAIMPNMLKPALILKNLMDVNNDNAADQAITDRRFNEWLRVLCAVLFTPAAQLKVTDIDLKNVLDNQKDDMILRVLSKTLIEAGKFQVVDGVRTPTFRLFSLCTDSQKDIWEPIAFTYFGLEIGLCPTVGLDRNNFAGKPCDPQGWFSCADVIEELNTDSKAIYRARIGECLNGQAYHLFGTELNYISRRIYSKLNPTVINTAAAFYPERINYGAQQNNYERWFTDSILCVSCEQTGEGVLSVPGKDFKCILPIRKRCIADGGDIQQIRDSATVAVQGDDLIVSFSYNGTTSPWSYTKDKQILCTGDENPLGSVMLWPNQSCPEWDRYFSYLSNDCQGKEENDLSLFSMDVYAGQKWHRGNDRKMCRRENNSTKNYVADSVIETQSFPVAISVKYDGAEIGMFVPKQDELSAVNRSQGQLGIDFGTTNTIAYFSVDNGNPTANALTISDNRKILLQNSAAASCTMLLPFLFAPDAIMGEKIPYKTAVQVFPGDPQAFVSAVAPLRYRADMRDQLRMTLNLQDDLKWPQNKAAAAQPNTVAFLEYLLLLWLWEIRTKYSLTNVDYVFTYPGAMPQAYIKKLVDAVMTRIPAAFRPTNTATNPQYVTEASVVINYLKDPATINNYLNHGYTGLVNPHVGYMLLDIGGGSVDVSLWQNGQLCSEFSIEKFAGDRLQTEQVYPRGLKTGPRIDLLLDIMGYDLSTIATATGKDAAFYSYVSQRVKTPGGKEEPIDANGFRQQWGAMVEDILEDMMANPTDALGSKRCMYRKTIEMYFHFLFFLTGYMYGQAANEGRFHVNGGSFCILMAGNGSRMYKLNGYEKDTDFDGINQSFFLNGIRYANHPVDKIEQNVTVYILPSVNHKHEVAHGACLYSGGIVKTTATHPATGFKSLASWAENNNAVDIDQLCNESVALFQAYIESLDEFKKGYLASHFGMEIDEEFYSNAKGAINGDDKLPTATAKMFCCLLDGIGKEKF